MQNVNPERDEGNEETDFAALGPHPHMTELSDQISTMASKQSRIGSHSGIPNSDNSAVPTGSGIPRVRFSTDTERSESPAPEAVAGRGMLTIDTSGAGLPPKEESPEIRSLGRLGGNSATETVETRTLPALHSPTSPTSPRKRNRGCSLRHQVLFRNIHGQDYSVAHSSANDIGIELTPTPETLTPKDKSTNSLHKGTADHDYALSKGALFSVASSLPHYTIWARKQSCTLRGQVRLYYKNVRNFLLRINEIPPSREGRKIPVDAERKTPLIDQKTGKEYINNTIRSRRYTIWSFFPKQLFAQFSKLANL